MNVETFTNKLLLNAEKFVGLVEVRDNSKWDNPNTRDNDKDLNDSLIKYLKKVPWWNLGSAYCAAFDGGIVILTAENFDLDPKAFRAQWTAHCMTNFERMSRLGYLSKTPKKGSLWLAQHNSGSSGHAGIVKSVINSETMITIEGNTSDDDSRSQREGDGIFEKERNIFNNGTLKTKGFIHPENIIKMLNSKTLIIPIGRNDVVRIQTYLESKNLHHLVDDAVKENWSIYDKNLKYSIAKPSDINKWLSSLK